MSHRSTSHVSMTESCHTRDTCAPHVTQETRHTVAEVCVKSYIVEPEMLSIHTHTFTRETTLQPFLEPSGCRTQQPGRTWLLGPGAYAGTNPRYPCCSNSRGVQGSKPRFQEASGAACLTPAQEWTNRIPNATNLSIPCFLVLPGSESTITEIAEYVYFSQI